MCRVVGTSVAPLCLYKLRLKEHNQMPDIQDILQGLGDDPVPQMDWNAPEQGSMPPPVRPGLYEFIFRLPEDESTMFDTIEVNVAAEGQPAKKVKFPQIVFEADVVADGQGNPIPQDEAGNYPRLRFQRASCYIPPKMTTHQCGELLRSMGFMLNTPPGAGWPAFLEAVKECLTAANGKRRFKGEVGWRAYFKSTETTVSTYPSKKRGHIRWPQGANKEYLDKATNPTNGETMYGQADIIRFKLPTATE